jgi:hypothetical protein
MFGKIGGGRRFGVDGLRRKGGTIWLRPRIRGIRGLILDLLIRSSSNAIVCHFRNMYVPGDPEHGRLLLVLEVFSAV